MASVIDWIHLKRLGGTLAQALCSVPQQANLASCYVRLEARVLGTVHSLQMLLWLSLCDVQHEVHTCMLWDHGVCRICVCEW